MVNHQKTSIDGHFSSFFTSKPFAKQQQNSMDPMDPHGSPGSDLHGQREPRVAHLSLPGHDGLGGEFLLDRLTSGRNWILWENTGKPWENGGKM